MECGSASEKFHAVSYTDEALRYAVYLSNRYIPDRFLPDKAIDLIDEAGARVKLRQATDARRRVGEVQKRVKFITHRMEKRHRRPRIRKGPVPTSEEERKEKRKSPRSAGTLQARRCFDGNCDTGRH